MDGAAAVGSSWREHWDSLQLFTPAQYNALPGLPFPQPADTYPGKDEVADYLQEYAARFAMPVRLSTRVTGLKRGRGEFLIETEGAQLSAEQVVVATGPFHGPSIPDLARDLSPEVRQLHSSGYLNPEALSTGAVLVVGGGNSGAQIAQELAASRQVYLSQGRRLPVVPPRLWGRSLFWWLETLGVTKVPADSALGRRMRGNDDVVIGARPRELLRAGRLVLLPRAVGAGGGVVVFADGRRLAVSTVIWATGYRSDYGWLDLPVLDAEGQPVHRRGVSTAAGLYFLGLRWQHTTGSALLGWVGHDAAFIAEQIVKQRERLSAAVGVL